MCVRYKFLLWCVSSQRQSEEGFLVFNLKFNPKSLHFKYISSPKIRMFVHFPIIIYHKTVPKCSLFVKNFSFSIKKILFVSSLPFPYLSYETSPNKLKNIVFIYYILSSFSLFSWISSLDPFHNNNRNISIQLFSHF